LDNVIATAATAAAAAAATVAVAAIANVAAVAAVGGRIYHSGCNGHRVVAVAIAAAVSSIRNAMTIHAAWCLVNQVNKGIFQIFLLYFRYFIIIFKFLFLFNSQPAYKI
jgi:hypothetical protein